MSLYYWTPQRLKELKERGHKIKQYYYDPRFRDQTIEEIEDQEVVDTEDTQK